MPHPPMRGANIGCMQDRSQSIHSPGPKKGLARLWQPRRGVFWLMVGFNLLSSFMGGVLRSDMLSPVGMAVVGVFALTNALAGMWLAWRLLRGD